VGVAAVPSHSLENLRWIDWHWGRSSLCSVSTLIIPAVLCQYAYHSCCVLSVCISFLLRSVSMHIIPAALCQYAYHSCCALSVCMSFLLRPVSIHVIPAVLCQYAYHFSCVLSVCISFLQCFLIIFILIWHLSKDKWAMHGNLHKNNCHLKYGEAWK
jgi:hypothetical protein